MKKNHKFNKVRVQKFKKLTFHDNKGNKIKQKIKHGTPGHRRPALTTGKGVSQGHSSRLNPKVEKPNCEQLRKLDLRKWDGAAPNKQRTKLRRLLRKAVVGGRPSPAIKEVRKTRQ